MSLDRASRRRKEKSLRKIKIVPTDFKLTATTGLGTVLKIFDQSPLACEFKKCLPERVSHRSAGSYLMALMVIAGGSIIKTLPRGPAEQLATCKSTVQKGCDRRKSSKKGMTRPPAQLH